MSEPIDIDIEIGLALMDLEDRYDEDDELDADPDDEYGTVGIVRMFMKLDKRIADIMKTAKKAKSERRLKSLSYNLARNVAKKMAKKKGWRPNSEMKQLIFRFGNERYVPGLDNPLSQSIRVTYGGVGRVDSKRLIEDTWEVAMSADSGAASVRNVQTGAQFTIHAGDRLGSAEVSHVDADGVEVAADDGSLYVVGVGARRGSKRKEVSHDPNDILPFDEWHKPKGVSEDHWANTVDAYKCGLGGDMDRWVRTGKMTSQQALEKWMSRGVYRLTFEKAEMQALGKRILERDGVNPNCEPRYVAAKIDYFEARHGVDSLSERYVAGRSLEQVARDECQEECSESPTAEDAAWEFESIDFRHQNQCALDFDNKYADVPWDEVVSAAKAGTLNRPVSSPSFGSSATSTILAHRYGSWYEQADPPPGHPMALDDSPVSGEVFGAVKAAGFFATGGGGRLYVP